MTKRKKEKSGYDILADHILSAPCHWCNARIMQGEKHKPTCRMGNNKTVAYVTTSGDPKVNIPGTVVIINDLPKQCANDDTRARLKECFAIILDEQAGVHFAGECEQCHKQLVDDQCPSCDLQDPTE